MIKIREWAIVDPDSNEYTPPELLRPRLAGKVFGHPVKPDGDLVVTSPIVAADGRIVTTKSGHAYELDGPPDPRYVAAGKACGFTIDEANPIRVRVLNEAPPVGTLLN